MQGEAVVLDEIPVERVTASRGEAQVRAEQPVDRDFEVLLTHLERDKQAISYDGDIIKFKSENESAPTPITKEDIAVVQLRDTLYRIKEQVPALDRKIAEADREVREALRTKQMSRAKSALRSKKLAESFLSQRTETALELEGVFIKLQQAVDQIEIVAAMQAGAAAMKGLHEKVGGAEGVQGVVDALNEQMATTEEITSIINESNQPVDESEIEDELEALEHAEKEKADQEDEGDRDVDVQIEGLNNAHGEDASDASGSD